MEKSCRSEGNTKKQQQQRHQRIRKIPISFSLQNTNEQRQRHEHCRFVYTANSQHWIYWTNTICRSVCSHHVLVWKIIIWKSKFTISRLRYIECWAEGLSGWKVCRIVVNVIGLWCSLNCNFVYTISSVFGTISNTLNTLQAPRPSNWRIIIHQIRDILFDLI